MRVTVGFRGGKVGEGDLSERGKGGKKEEKG